MTTDFRALCKELADHLQARVSKEDQAIPAKEYYSQTQQLIDRARAALTVEPVGAYRPSRREILALMDEQDKTMDVDILALVRAAIVRWGTPNLAQVRSSVGDGPLPQATDGEVAELVRWVRFQAETDACPDSMCEGLHRTADLLSRLAPQPVPDGPTRRVYFDMPSTIAECDGPCSEGGPEACDCGTLWRDEPAPQPVPEGPTVMEIIELSNELDGSGDVALVRAALSRWGQQPASKPYTLGLMPDPLASIPGSDYD